MQLMSVFDWRDCWKVCAPPELPTHPIARQLLPPHAELYDEYQKMCVVEVEPPLLLSLPRSQERLSRLFSAQLAGIGVRLQSRAGRLEACTLPAVLMEREAGERHRGHPAVAASILQVPVCVWLPTCTVSQ